MDKKKNSFIIIKHGAEEIGDHGNRLLESSIKQQLDMREGSIVKVVLVSLKDAQCNGSFKNLKMLIEHMEKLSKKLDVSISLIDYSLEMYPILKQISQNSSIRLFKNLNVAYLFIDPKSYKKNITVLIFEEDEATRAKLLQELSRYGYTVIIAKDAYEFGICMDEAQHDIVITHSALNMNIGIKKQSMSLNLSKKLILNLPLFMDTAVETLVSFTGLEAQKLSHSIKNFDTKISDDIICSVMHFKGDLDGFFTLVFPKDLAIIAMETLLGETVLEDDLDTLKDGVAEFCNIITGGIKSALVDKDIKVIFELPKAFVSLVETNEYIGSNNGVWIDMQLADKPFYMFLTK